MKHTHLIILSILFVVFLLIAFYYKTSDANFCPRVELKSQFQCKQLAIGIKNN